MDNNLQILLQKAEISFLNCGNYSCYAQVQVSIKITLIFLDLINFISKILFQVEIFSKMAEKKFKIQNAVKNAHLS